MKTGQNRWTEIKTARNRSSEMAGGRNNWCEMKTRPNNQWMWKKIRWTWLYRLFGYERVYLPLYKVTDTPFHSQRDKKTEDTIIITSIEGFPLIFHLIFYRFSCNFAEANIIWWKLNYEALETTCIIFKCTSFSEPRIQQHMWYGVRNFLNTQYIVRVPGNLSAKTCLCYW